MSKPSEIRLLAILFVWNRCGGYFTEWLIDMAEELLRQGYKENELDVHLRQNLMWIEPTNRNSCSLTR